MKRISASGGNRKEKPYRNPYLAPIISRFVLLVFFFSVYVIWFRHTPYDKILYIMVATLTLSIVPYVSRYFKFRKFKKKHPEPAFDRHYFETEDAVDSFPYH